jgi:hypothetical protein
MSKYHILLDSLKLNEPLSEYIKESNDLANSAALNNTPSLLKFIVSEKKDFIDNINENKFRVIKDNVTDAFVNTFFIGDDNYEKLNMLIDYQYHFIYFNIMLVVNNFLMEQGPSNRNGEKIENENLYPLQDNEHILLNFKGGSTMYYLYNNIINHLKRKGTVDITKFKDINKFFKISDIDLALNIETANSYRYFQLESIVSYLLTIILEDLTNKLEFMYLNTICLNLGDSYKDDPLIKDKIEQIKTSLKLNETLGDLSIVLSGNKRVYADIYDMKLEINDLKKKLIDNINSANITLAFDFIKKFIEYNVSLNNSTLKSVDMLEISLLVEFVSYMTNINYTVITGFITHQVLILNIYTILKNYGNYLLNVKYKYLLNNFYNTLKFDTFIDSIKTGLHGINTSSLDKAKISHAEELASGKFRKRICITDEKNDPLDGAPYFQDYRYFTDTKSERKSHYNLVSNTEIINDKINFSGRENFLLRPQDSSKFPYVIVTTSNTGLNSADIKDLKKNIISVKGGNKVGVEFPNKVVKELDFSNENNIHYLSINKSIFMENNRFVTTFNLFRIKFNVVLSNLIETINIDKLPPNNCISTPQLLSNTPSEFLDVGVGSKDDTFHSIVDEIEEHNNGIVFNITYKGDPVRTIPEEYGTESRILSYTIQTFAADLNNVLYCQQKIPWLDLKYQKRLFRLLFYIFNVLQNDSVTSGPTQTANAIINSVFKKLFNNINHAAINYDNIVINHNNFIKVDHNFSLEEMIQTFISQISITGSDVSMTTATIKDLILSDRELHSHLLLPAKYKIGNGFFSYTIIYILLIKKLKDEITTTPANLQLIIAEYSKLIQIFYDRSGVTFNIKNYDNDENQMNESIVKGFINDFGSYIKNITDAINILEQMFTPDFDYNTYDILPINS